MTHSSLRLRSLFLARAGIAIAMSASAVCAQASTLDNSRPFFSTGTNELQMTAPDIPAQACPPEDFGTVAIRIGFHASLKACYREIKLAGHDATAFVTVPREFDNKQITAEQFARLRDDIVRSETDQFEQARKSRASADTRPRVALGLGANQGAAAVTNEANAAIPLGVFDNTAKRVGYAYAFGVQRVDKNEKAVMQAMMRTETFVHVGDAVIVVMIIAPVDSGNAAGLVFDASERWADAIIAANIAQPIPWQPTRSKPQAIGTVESLRK